MDRETLLKMGAAYRKHHEASGFKVDDPVIIKKAASTLEGGWVAGWLPEMDRYVGQQGYIARDNKEVGFFIEFEDGTSFHFPFFILEKGTIVEEVVAELPFEKGRYWATTSQEDALLKNLEDHSDSKLGNIPNIVIDVEGNIVRSGMGDACLGSLHSRGSKRSPKLNKNPVLFLRWFPHYSKQGGMTKNEILAYHDYLKHFSPWTQYIVHFKNAKLNEHFFGIRLKDVPANLPLMLGTHARMPWDSYQTTISFEYHLLAQEAPKATPGELAVVASMVYSQEGRRDGSSSMFYARVKSGGHAMWGGTADPHVFKEYLEGELDKRRYDTDAFKIFNGHGMGVESPFSSRYNKGKYSINEFLIYIAYKGLTKTAFGETYVAGLSTPELRCENVTKLINLIKGLK